MLFCKAKGVQTATDSGVNDCDKPDWDAKMVKSQGKWGEWRGGCLGDWQCNRWNTCPLAPSTKESKNIAKTTPASGAAPSSGNIHDERIYYYLVYWYSCQASPRGQRRVHVWLMWLWDLEYDGISLTKQQAEKVSNRTTQPALTECLHGTEEVLYLFLCRLDFSSLWGGVAQLRGSTWAGKTLDSYRGGTTHS